ncbi:MAG: alpha/beta hydrolase [Gemmatimonadota bacterium]|nr:MAG: alpha/beta hydrolase [Gemmatimonadota bacterium]
MSKQVRVCSMLGLVFGTAVVPMQAVAQSSHTVSLPEVELHYEVFGEGFPILLLAGGPGASNKLMMRLVPELQDSWQLVLIDQRATGQSHLQQIDSSTINLDDYVEDIEAVRRDLGADSVLLLGHSWGGMLAMAVAAKYPDHVAGMILVGSGGMDLENFYAAQANVWDSPESQRVFEFWGAPERFAANPQLALYEIYRAIMPSRVFDPADVMEVMADLKFDDIELSMPEVAELMFQDLGRIGYDLRPQLRSYQRPVLVVQGYSGFMVHAAYQIRDNIPGARTAFIDRCGHFPYHEQPEAFYKVVREFLNQHFVEGT